MQRTFVNDQASKSHTLSNDLLLNAHTHTLSHTYWCTACVIRVEAAAFEALACSQNAALPFSTTIFLCQQRYRSRLREEIRSRVSSQAWGWMQLPRLKHHTGHWMSVINLLHLPPPCNTQNKQKT